MEYGHADNCHAVFHYNYSTNRSIEFIISGIVINPIPITVQDLATGEINFFLSSIHLDVAHTLLIVRPGIMTEAKPCHSRVSNTAKNALLQSCKIK